MPFRCRNLGLNFLLILVTFLTTLLFYFKAVEIGTTNGRLLLFDHESNKEMRDLKRETIRNTARIIIQGVDFESNPFFRKWRNIPCRRCTIPRMEFLLSGVKNCKQTNIKILFMINSKPKNFVNRKAVRETWANEQEMESYSMGYIFLIGTTTNTVHNDIIHHEAEQFGDIVQVDTMDTYANLTLKTLAGFKWISLNCKGAEIVFKTDDDMWINMYVLNETIDARYLDNQAIYGNCFGSGHPHRNPKSKWYTPYKFYPFRWYPSFCLRSALIMKSTIVRTIWNPSKDVPFFHLEDVYISGLVAANTGINRIPTSSLQLDQAAAIKEQLCLKNMSAKAVLLKDINAMYKIRIKKETCSFIS